MRENNNADKEKSREEFHSLINLDSKDWKVEANEDNQSPKESNIMYEKEVDETKLISKVTSSNKRRWMIAILVALIVTIGSFFIANWYKHSSQESELDLISGETYTENEFSNNADDENDSDYINGEKQEKTTSKIIGLISSIIGQESNESETEVTAQDIQNIKDEESEEVTEVVTNASGEAVSDKEGNAVTEVETDAEEKTEKPSESKTEKPTQSASEKPSSTAEIVEYFNKAVNGVKTSAKSVKQHSVVNYLVAPITIGDGLIGIYRMLGGDDWLDGMLQSNSTGEATYTGSDIKKNYPVENESWASKLTAADVSSATCTEKDGVYTIKIVTKADAKTGNVKHGQGHNPKVFSVVLPGTINENIPSIAKAITGDVTMNYPSGSVVITVDAATGHVLTAVYDAHWTINFDMMSTVLPFATKSTYTIIW